MATADPVLTLADLETWSFAGTALAVLGHPIKHSISPVMHNAALSELARTDARFADWRYFRFDVPPEDLPRALKLFHEKKFLGLNLTVPHKVIAFDHVATVHSAARPIGAVNTLLANAQGWQGFNTDGYGLATAIREDLGFGLENADVILLGAGGAARGAAVECLQRRCRSLWIGNRTRQNLDALLTVLEPLKGTIPVTPFTLDEPIPKDFPQGAIFIQATTLGLHTSDTVPFRLRDLPHLAGVFDMIYNPPETPLLAQARKRELPFANGLSMLIHQGARALEIWTDTPVPVSAMRAAAHAAMKM